MELGEQERVLEDVDSGRVRDEDAFPQDDGHHHHDHFGHVAAHVQLQRDMEYVPIVEGKNNSSFLSQKH